MTEAGELTGKMVLVGLVFYDENGSVLKQEQRHGRISAVGPNGIALALTSGDRFVLPPDASLLQPAPRGSFREQSSGEVVEGPDFIASWFLIRNVVDGAETWTWRPAPRISFPPDAPHA